MIWIPKRPLRSSMKGLIGGWTLSGDLQEAENYPSEVKKVFRSYCCQNWSGHESIPPLMLSLLLGWSQSWKSWKLREAT
jgi:hypothetical protein